MTIQSKYPPHLVRHFPVLNALAEMQASKIYAVRASDLATAESTIVHLADELEKTQMKLNEALVQLEQVDNPQGMPV